MATKIIDVECKFGHLLFARYTKDRAGFLMKCYVEKIGEDKIGISKLPNETVVFCPECKREGRETKVGRIAMVHGKPAIVINHGGVKRIKT